MGKNRVQKKNKQLNKPSNDNIYSQKHVRITLMKQEKMKEKVKDNGSVNGSVKDNGSVKVNESVKGKGKRV